MGQPGKTGFMRYVTDTHALYWHLTKNPKLSKKAKKIFQEADTGVHQVMIPGIVLIEMVYLVEKSRINETSLTEVFELLDTVGGSYDVAPLNKDTVTALQQISREVVPDMPDRIIAATALQLDIPLITRDRQIKNAGNLKTIW